MRFLRLAGSVAVVLVAWWHGDVAAQQRVAVESSAVYESEMAEALLARQVTLDIRNVSLQEAIDQLAATAEVLIQYRTRSISAYPALVTVRADNEPLGIVLARLLDHTALRVIADGASQLMVVERTQKAREQGILSGKVVHAQTKQPIPGVTIRLDGDSKSIAVKDDGTFQISVTPGSHTLEVRALGFSRQVLQRNVQEGKTVTLEIALMPSAGVLSEVVVTGTVIATERRAIGTPITVITAEDIERRGITRVEEFFRGEVPGVLALDEGVEVYSGGNTNITGGIDTYGGMATSKIFARGSSDIGNESPIGFAKPTPLKTFIDGVEILDPSYIGTIDPASIERIEIITGPQAATLYGSGAMGGVMQIFTKKGNGRDIEIKARLKYGVLQNSLSNGLAPSHNHTLGLNGGSGPDFTYSANLSYRYSGQWRPGLFSRTYGMSAGLTHARGNLTMSGSASFTKGRNGTTIGGLIPASLFARERRATGEFGPINEAEYLTQRIATAAGQMLSLNADYRIAKNLRVSATVGRSQNKFANIPEAPKFSEARDSLYRTGETTGERTTWGTNISGVLPETAVLSSNMVLGFNGSSGENLLVQGCKAASTSTSYLTCHANSSGSISGLKVRNILSDANWGGFLRWQIGFFDRLYATFGIRGEKSSNYGHSRTIDWTPTNQFAFTMDYRNLTIKLLGAYGRATREPLPDHRLEAVTNNASYDPSQWISRFANPMLRPEYSRGPEGGIELYYGNRASLTLNHYTQRITDLIEEVLVDSVEVLRITDNTHRMMGQYQYINTASVKQHGWEGTASLNLYRFEIRGTYSWNDSRVLFVNQDQRRKSVQPGQSFRGLPTHMANIRIGYAHGPASLMVTTNWVGAKVLLSSGDPRYLLNDRARLQMYNEWSDSYGVYGQFSKPGYAKTNLAASHRIRQNVSMTLNVTNIGNTFHSDLAAWAPALGRQTLLGISIQSPRR